MNREEAIRKVENYLASYFPIDETMIQKIRRGKRNDGCKVY